MRILLPLLAATLAAAEPGYDLHEWGVFTVNPGNPFAQQDYKEEWASFPTFFTKQPPLPQNGKAGVVVRKPVVFVRADGDLALDLSFTLRGGRPLVWWPDAVATGETLRFTVSAFDRQMPRNASPVLRGPEVPPGHWIEHLRAANGDFLISTLPAGQRRNTDSFLYYDGLIPALPQPAVTPAGAEKHPHWTVSNPAAYPLLDVLLVWKRGDDLRASPWQDDIPPGGQATLPLWPLATVIAKDGALDAQLQHRLIAAGLDDAEATSLVRCWKDGLFAQEGLSLIYRLPQAT